MTQSNAWDIGGDAGNSFQFDQIGASVTGPIKSLSEVQQTNITTGEPEFWPGGQAKMMYRLTLATSQRDPANPLDDGTRDVYLKGSRKPESMSSLAAVLQAVKLATGGTNLEPGGVVTLTYVGDGQPEKGKNPPKQYAATYVRPPMNLGGPSAAPVQQAYAPQQYPPQQPAQPVHPVQQFAPQQQVAQPPQQAYAPQQPAQQYATAQPAPQAAAAPAQAPAPVPAAAQQWPWTDAALAAVRASGTDPAAVWPDAWPAYLAAGGR